MKIASVLAIQELAPASGQHLNTPWEWLKYHWKTNTYCSCNDSESMVINKLVDIEALELVQCLVHCEWLQNEWTCFVDRNEVGCMKYSIEADDFETWLHLFNKFRHNNPKTSIIVWPVRGIPEFVYQSTWKQFPIMDKWEKGHDASHIKLSSTGDWVHKDTVVAGLTISPGRGRTNKFPTQARNPTDVTWQMIYCKCRIKYRDLDVEVWKCQHCSMVIT